MKKSDILNALTIVKPGLSNKEIIEQSSSFAFMGDRVVTYNDEISISHPIEGLDITGAIKADILYGLLAKIKKDEIEITCTDKEIQISSGRTKAGIILQSEVKLPIEEISQKTKWKKLPDKFNENLKFAAGGCSSDMSTPVLTCVSVVNEGLMYSSDNYKLLQIKMDKIPSKSFLLPANSAILVAKMNPEFIAEGEGWIHFKTKEQSVISCRILEDKFPDIAKALDVDGVKVTLPNSLAEVLGRAGIFSKREHLTDENVEIVLGNKRLSVKSKAEFGWFEETINMSYSEKPISFNITPYLLEDILSATHECEIGENRLKFESENWIYVTLLKY